MGNAKSHLSKVTCVGSQAIVAVLLYEGVLLIILNVCICITMVISSLADPQFKMS